MKFSAFFAIALAAVASVAEASTVETNANRLARGLPPMPPVRRGTPVEIARRHKPSSTPPSGQCNTGSVQCCNEVQRADSSGMSGLLGLLGVVISGGSLVGTNCSPISAIGLGGNSCNSQPVCCSNNNFNGLVALGCSPVNL
ncbi:fungal hydrophobin [Pluteus cervinus]|uniref:Fungal hydrophobin n=1 Tax=Pluteus cervinus TaxID=181527 RepID=A0ACD3BBR7_9AGAR|nr:fungal hydrophobin [Pluteus cervinus]